MIAFLEGRIAAKGADRSIISVGGVGHELLMSTTSLQSLPPVDDQAHVITYLSVTDNGIALYGFMSSEEEQLFKSLIAVSGIGPKMALAALSTYAPDELARAITSEDVKAISKIPGVGKKTASRIVLELKGALPSEDDAQDAEAPSNGPSLALLNAIDALLSMGFTRNEVDAALTGAEADANEEALLQYALKRIV